MSSRRSCWIAGRATFTTVVSTMTTKRLAVTAASVHHLRFRSIAAVITLVQYVAGGPRGLPPRGSGASQRTPDVVGSLLSVCGDRHRRIRSHHRRVGGRWRAAVLPCHAPPRHAGLGAG